jgi:phosphoenolpyruvate-protein phosphotransferase
MKMKEYLGEVLSPGAARGKLCFFDGGLNSLADAPQRSIEDVQNEIQRFDKQVEAVADELAKVADILQKDSYIEECEIIKTHILMLNDPVFHRRVYELISRNQVRAEVAVEYVLKETIEILESSENAIVAEKSGDLQDLLLRLKMKLLEEDNTLFDHVVEHVDKPVVYVRELLPSLVIEARKLGVVAIVVEKGTSLSHAAILAKSFDMPVLKVTKLQRTNLQAMIDVFVDAVEGRLIIHPSVHMEQAERGRRPSPIQLKGTKLPVSVWLNISDPEQVCGIDWQTVNGIGLYRSELLFMQYSHRFPSEDEQYDAYAQLTKQCLEYPVTIRTLDIGGDKSLPYFSLGPQENPYLGLRGNRLFRYHPEIFITQMKAILRAGSHVKNLRVLFPMVENVDDLLFLFDLVERAIDTLRSEKKQYAQDFKRGALIEVPSAVWNFQNLLPHLDFASLGTNDLLQYFFAVDRNNSNVEASYRPEDPGALRMLKYLVETSKEFDKQITICGEIASDPYLLPVLIGLGFENLSIDPQALLHLYPFLANIDPIACRQVAERCLQATNSNEVKEIIDEAGICQTAHTESTLETTENESVDPVCKMVVHTTGNNLFVVQHRRRYFFCSRYCRQQFIEEQKVVS